MYIYYKNVTVAYDLDALLNKLKRDKFSILIDGSTDYSSVIDCAVVVCMALLNYIVETVSCIRTHHQRNSKQYVIENCYLNVKYDISR